MSADQTQVLSLSFQVSLSADSRQIAIQLHCFHDDMVGLH